MRQPRAYRLVISAIDSLAKTQGSFGLAELQRACSPISKPHIRRILYQLQAMRHVNRGAPPRVRKLRVWSINGRHWKSIEDVTVAYELYLKTFPHSARLAGLYQIEAAIASDT